MAWFCYVHVINEESKKVTSSVFFMKSKIKDDLVNEGQFFNWLLKD